MENEGVRADRSAAEARLATLQAQRAAPAKRAMQPWWYDALLGPVCVAVALGVGFTAELVLDLSGAMVVAGAVLAIGLLFVSRWWSRLYIAELRDER
jgi:hypothetical protein